jgi:hypothetical protein
VKDQLPKADFRLRSVPAHSYPGLDMGQVWIVCASAKSSRPGLALAAVLNACPDKPFQWTNPRSTLFRQRQSPRAAGSQ